MTEQAWGLIALCGGMLLVLIIASVFTQRYSLNRIKSKTVGDGQHGTARWATPKEIRKVCSAFLVDDVRHKIRKDNAACQNTDAEQQHCQNCEDTVFYRRPHLSFIFQEFILPVQWSDTRRGRGTAC